MKKYLTYEITPKYAHLKIETFLRTQGFSRHIITHIKKTKNGICLNDEWAYVNQKLSTGDRLSVMILEDISSPQIVPVPMALDIVYEDEDLMVINKAADMPIHPSINNYDNTLANGVAHYFQSQGVPFVYRCINRLDRDTTGLLIIAKHMLSAALLSKALGNREIHREYRAIAWGMVPASGVIDAPIGRRTDSLIERCIDFGDGERAVTHFRTVKVKDGCSLVALKLETGRTHQIRVHMKYLGHPLVGESLYCLEQTMKGACSDMRRQALHSYRLRFIHPFTKEEMLFTAPLPDDMKWIL